MYIHVYVHIVRQIHRNANYHSKDRSQASAHYRALLFIQHREPNFVYSSQLEISKSVCLLFAPWVQGCQMVCFQIKNPNLGKFWKIGKCLCTLWPFWTFSGDLGYFMTIWYIFYSFGTFFPRFWYHVPRNIWQPLHESHAKGWALFKAELCSTLKL
jgi:hypothetical protein